MSEAVYTANQIATALEVSPQAVRKSLSNVPQSKTKIVAGNEAAAWVFQRLPESLRNRLATESSRRGYRSAEAMLSAPDAAKEPAPALDKIREMDIDHATKLRTALRPWLAQRHSLRISSAEMEAQGVADYARQFGSKISTRYWRKLSALAIERDRGAENWDRLELYLPKNPQPKASAQRSVDADIADEFADVESYIQACGNPIAPSETEQRHVWLLALEKQAHLVRGGWTEKQAARLVRQFLFAKAAFLAPSRDALWLAFKRKLSALVNSGGDPKALRDRREENGQPFELPEADRDLLINRAVWYYGGRTSQAWRDLLRSGFSEPVRQRYADKAASKSHVPASIRESVEPEIEIFIAMHQGPRAFDSIKGHVERNYDGVHSLVCMSADDFTFPCYWYVPDGKGWFTLTRGQTLVFIDFRSLAILGWSMQPDRNYSSLTIRSLCTHVFGTHGVPKVLQFERGIWKSSSLLTGRRPPPFEFSQVVNGLHEFGIKFIHSIRPRSKTVERVGGLLQDLMEAEPGYCGRNERKDAPESLRKQMATVEARNAHPSKFFFSYDQWYTRFGEIVDAYNAAPQQGRMLDGISPDDALKQFADEKAPMPFTAGARYLLAHDKRVCKVTLNGVTIQVGKKNFNYRGAEIAHLVGRDVLAWFDTENPESLVVTDMQRKNPICVGRSNPVDALECVTAPDSGQLATELRRIEDQASYMKARFKVVHSKHPMPQIRLLADTRTLQLGRQIEEQKSQREQAAVNVQRNRKRAHTLARQMNVPAALVDNDPETLRGLELLAEAERQHQAEKENHE